MPILSRPVRLVALLAALPLLAPPGPAVPAAEDPELRVFISVDPSLREQPVTGRMFLMISPLPGEPRLVMPSTFAYYFNEPTLPYPQIFGMDVDALEPEESVVIAADTLGYPLTSLVDLEPAEYSVQALVNVYTRFDRSDGHTIWAHMDQGEGQQFHISPGNLYSEVERIHLDPTEGFELDLVLTREIPPIPRSLDTEYLKRMEIKSELVSDFWGRDMTVTATALLPKGYQEHPDVHYRSSTIRGISSRTRRSTSRRRSWRRRDRRGASISRTGSSAGPGSPMTSHA